MKSFLKLTPEQEPAQHDAPNQESAPHFLRPLPFRNRSESSGATSRGLGRFPSLILRRHNIHRRSLSECSISSLEVGFNAPPTPLRQTTLETLEQNESASNWQQNLDKPLPLPPSGGSTPRSDDASAERFTSAPFTADEQRDAHAPGLLSGSHIQRGGAMDVSGAAAGHYSQSQYTADPNASVTSLNHGAQQNGAPDGLAARTNGQAPGGVSPGASGARTPTSGSSSSHLSGLMCNVHRTTGREPHPLVGATTTILGDKLYVFGGRILSRSRPAPLTSDLYELDLIRRHWTKLETSGDVPPPRYFHSMCALGDTKMVCYGGMSPTTANGGSDQQSEVSVMSDIYIYDVPTRKWTYVPTQDPPEGRYAHCATILPSTAAFSSHRAPLSALQHNPSSGNPNEGRIGIDIDGAGGAEMIVVGGQDGANHYIEQVSVFNLRSLQWTATQSLGKSCGAYRSVAAALPPSLASQIGRAYQNGTTRQEQSTPRDATSSMLIYSNYNFLDVKLELQIRTSDGTLHERPMSGTYSPPGLRFPNGGVLDNHFVVSGTYLTSSKQEYALWALDLRTLTWSRIDAGGNVFSQGSWNRGVLWGRRNTFVILGNRKRSLVDDYNHRRINFSNVCMVELEAFGFYDNPRRSAPLSGFVSASSPYTGPGLSFARKAGYTAGGRYHSRASEELGEKALAVRELSDMDILCIGGERLPINSRIVARRWGPYFVQLLREGTATQDGSDAATLRSGPSRNALRASAVTITPEGSARQGGDNASLASTALSSAPSSNQSQTTASSAGSSMASSVTAGAGGEDDVHGGATTATTTTTTTTATAINAAPTPRSLAANSRPRCLYLPHTYLTVQALLHFVYTSSLPAASSPLCTPQILCSLLQVARPYRIDGLLEAVIERLHALLDSRNAAAVFNATAMAAGGGRGIDGSLNPNFSVGAGEMPASEAAGTTTLQGLSTLSLTSTGSTGGSSGARPGSAGEGSAGGSQSGSEWSSDTGEEGGRERSSGVWNGDVSSVIGLQKRGLRGLMEGRRMRERGGGYGQASQQHQHEHQQHQPHQPHQQAGQRVGLGIAGGQ